MMSSKFLGKGIQTIGAHWNKNMEEAVEVVEDFTRLTIILQVDWLI